MLMYYIGQMHDKYCYRIQIVYWLMMNCFLNRIAKVM